MDDSTTRVSPPGCISPNQSRDLTADSERGETPPLRSAAAGVEDEPLSPKGAEVEPLSPKVSSSKVSPAKQRMLLPPLGGSDGSPGEEPRGATTFGGLLKQLYRVHTQELSTLQAKNAELVKDNLQLSAKLGQGSNGSIETSALRAANESPTGKADADSGDQIVRIIQGKPVLMQSRSWSPSGESGTEKCEETARALEEKQRLKLKRLDPSTPNNEFDMQSPSLHAVSEGAEEYEHDHREDVSVSHEEEALDVGDMPIQRVWASTSHGLNQDSSQSTSQKTEPESDQSCRGSGRYDRQSFLERFEGAGESLKIHIEYASNLRAADWMMGRKSDPYCIVEIHSKPWSSHQTEVITNTLNPEWNRSFELKDFRPGDSLKFTVKDKDWTSADDILGKANLVNMQFYPGGFDGELKLTEAGNGGRRIHKGAFLKVRVEAATFVPVTGTVARLWPAWQQIPVAFKDLRRTQLRMGAFTQALAENGGRTLTHHVLKHTQMTVMKPDSLMRLVWDIMGIVVLLIDLIWIPMQVFDPPDSTGVQFVEWFTLIYWTIDIFMTVNTGFYTADQQLVMRRMAIICRYLKTWCLFDIALVSVDWSLNARKWSGGDLESEGVEKSSGMARAGRLARVTRIIRLLRLMRLARLRQFVFQLQCLIDSESLMVMFAISNNLFIILAINHYIACLWYGVGAASPHRESWITRYKYREKGYGIQYVTALHWSMSQFTPGPHPIQPESVLERITAVSVLGCGLVVFTCFMSSITSTMSAVWTLNRYNNTQEFLLKKFLRQKQISRSLGSRITRYIDFVVRLRHKSIPMSKVHHLQMLSGPLHIELQTELVEPHLCFHSFFMAYSTFKPVMRELCNTAVESHSFAKNDVLFRANQEAKCMYFVTQGSLIYRYRMSAKKKQLENAKLHEEQWASEAVLWMPWTHKGVLRVLSDADILTLNSAKFRDVTATSPDTFMLAHRYALNYLVHVQIVDESEQEGLTDVSPEFLLAYGEGDDLLGSEIIREIREAEEIEARLVAMKEEQKDIDAVSGDQPTLRTDSTRRFLTSTFAK